jgi:hypothetical protein
VRPSASENQPNRYHDGECADISLVTVMRDFDKRQSQIAVCLALNILLAISSTIVRVSCYTHFLPGMKQARAIVPFLLVGAFSFFVTYKVSHVPQTSESQASPQTSDAQCDPKLWQYVYHPARLQVLGDSCISVSGSVEDIRKEADGDLHILFRLDQQFESLLNEKNMSKQHGDLVLEPICQGTIRQADATEPCSRYNGPYFEPQIGQRYLVSGVYVYDVDHGWHELHPVSSMQPIQ